MKLIFHIKSVIVCAIMVFCSGAFAAAEPAGTEGREGHGVKMPVYSAGPWTGRVVEADTARPIEGAAVAALWYRSFDTGFSHITDFHEAKETLTDEQGYFEIPAYTETGEDRETWPKPQQPGPEGPIELAVTTVTISDPVFIIYKTGYDPFPDDVGILVFAAEPFSVKYKEFYTGIINNERVRLERQKTKDFPEGLVYAGKKCFSVMAERFREADFRFNTLFIPMNNAREKLEALEIPFECPEKAEAVPVRVTAGPGSLETPLQKGGFIVVGLSRRSASKDREAVTIPQLPAEAGPDRLPCLRGMLDEEKEQLMNQEQKGRQEKTGK